MKAMLRNGWFVKSTNLNIITDTVKKNEKHLQRVSWKCQLFSQAMWMPQTDKSIQALRLNSYNALNKENFFSTLSRKPHLKQGLKKGTI